MRVLGITDEHSGCGFHRVSLPVGCLDLPQEDKFITNDTSEERFSQGWDVVVFNRFIHDLDLMKLLRYQRDYGFKIVCDIDDHWELDPHHILHDDYKEGLALQTTNSIKIADLVTCTHERLAEKIRPLNSNVVVIPNALPYGELNFDDHKSESENVRFIYAGSVTHEKDLNLLKNPFKRISSDILLKNKCEFILCGYDDSNQETKKVWDKMLNVFSVMNGKVLRGVPVYQYMNFYNDSDVSLVPLIASPFNAMKSNLKVLEAATKKNPCIVSHVDPYLELPVRYINNQKQWYDNIKFYANEKQAREDDGNRLFEYCNEHFNLRKWSEYRKQVFEALVNNLKVA